VHAALTRAKKAKGSKRPGRARMNQSVTPTGQTAVIPRFGASKAKVKTFYMWESTPRTINSSTSASSSNGYTFSINLLADSTIFGTFDAYRIKSVTLVAKPASEVGTVSIASGSDALVGAFDPDDNNAFGVVTTLAKEDARVHSMWESWEERIFPIPSIAVFSGGAFSGYSLPGEAPWIDSDNLTVPHYGWKYGVFQARTASSVSIFVRYELECVLTE
jgi:hypothetical protein